MTEYSVTSARRLALLPLLAIAFAGCGGGRIGGWSRADFERCVGNDADAISVLGPADMTSPQLEQHQAIARDFVQVQYLGGEVADIYFTRDAGESTAIRDRLAHPPVPSVLPDAGVWRDDHVVVDVWSTGGTISPRIKPALERCARMAANR